MITKPVSLITSTGRTGTRFLGLNAQYLIRDCCSDHEPDVIKGLTLADAGRAFRFGPYNTVIGRLRGRTGLRNHARALNEPSADSDDIARRIVRERRRIYERCRKSLFVESNPQWVMLLPILERVFADFVVAGVVRHPYDYIGSMADHATVMHRKWYGVDQLSVLRRLRNRGTSRLADTSGVPADLAGDRRWRLAWSWQFHAGSLVEWAATRENARIFRFEDVFRSAECDQRQQLLAFIARDPGRVVGGEEQSKLFRRVTNTAPRTEAREISQYAPRLMEEIRRLCGPYAQQLGYEL